MMTPSFSLLTRIVWSCLCAWTPVLMAEKTVFLDRLGREMWEPYFNPKSIVADVGEQVQFVSRFDDFTSLHGANFTPFAWGFAESEFSSPCIYNQGFFSGLWIIDTRGSWNGSVFTLTVNDQEPHFIYSISLASSFINNCSKLVEYQANFNIPLDSDVIFAINPTSDKSFDGYKDQVNLSINVNETYYSAAPRNGELFIAVATAQTTGSESNGTSALAISQLIAAVVWSLILGAFAGWYYTRSRLRSNTSRYQPGYGVFSLMEYPETLRNQDRESRDFDDPTFK